MCIVANSAVLNIIHSYESNHHMHCIVLQCVALHRVMSRYVALCAKVLLMDFSGSWHLCIWIFVDQFTDLETRKLSCMQDTHIQANFEQPVDSGSIYGVVLYAKSVYTSISGM